MKSAASKANTPGTTNLIPSGAESKPRRLLSLLIIAFAIVRIVAMAIRAVYLIPCQIDNSFPEGAVVARAADMAGGSPAYADWRQWPHQFAPYGPLTYYPIGWMARVAFRNPTARVIYILGRLQSTISLVGISALVAFFLSRLGVSFTWRMLGVLFFVLWLRLLEYVASYRPDAPQTFFALLALAVALSGRARGWRLIVALFFLWISFWFKPTSWGILAALGFWIGRDRGWRVSLASLAAFGASGLAAAWAMNTHLHGLLFLNVITSLNNGWTAANLASFYKHLTLAPAFVLTLGLPGLALLWARAKRAANPVSPERATFTFAVLASFITACIQNLKVGADINYYLELYALACAGAAYVFARLAEGEFDLRGTARTAILAIFLLPILTYDTKLEMEGLAPHLRLLKGAWGEMPIMKFARQFDGPILTSNPFVALAKPSPPTLLDHVQFMIMSKRGFITPRGLFERIEGRQFDVIILATGSVPDNAAELESEKIIYDPLFFKALYRSYRIIERNPTFTVFAPRR